MHQSRWKFDDMPNRHFTLLKFNVPTHKANRAFPTLEKLRLIGSKNDFSPMLLVFSYIKTLTFAS